jgi:hypothetical protein
VGLGHRAEDPAGAPAALTDQEKSLALPAALSAARPKRLRFVLFTLAGRVLTHAGQLVLRISHEAERLVELVAARTRLAAVRVRVASG